MCELFPCNCESNIINYAGHTTLYVSEANMNLLSSNLKKTPLQFLHGFRTTVSKFSENLMPCQLTLEGINSIVATMKNY